MSVAARLSEKVGEKKNIINNIGENLEGGAARTSAEAENGRRTRNAESEKKTKTIGDERDARRSEWGEKGD